VIVAKACAYFLCRQCCCIDGFGEFGEKSLNLAFQTNW